MNRKHIYIVVVLLIVACLAAFGRIADNDFINYDDNQYITENRHIQSGFNSQTLEWALTAVVVSNCHPLTLLSHMLDWQVFGADAAGHHLVSLLLHIGTVILLFLFLYKTTNNLWPSAFAAAFFALHPLRVESIAWASERKDVLSMFFGMACIYAYAFYVENKKPHKYFLCLILFALALMSKPMLVTLPCILLLLDYWPLKRLPVSDSTGSLLKNAGRLVWEKVPFFVLAMASGIVTFWAQNKGGAILSMETLPFFNRALNTVVSFIGYLEKIFLPINLAVFYPFEMALPLWQVMVSGMILVLISAAVIYHIRKLPFLFTGWFWYLGALVPVIGLVQVGSQAMADRYTYLPSIGIAIILAWGMPLLFQKDVLRRNILFPAAIVVLIILSVLSWRQSGYWRDSITLFSRALQVTENNFLAHNNLAIALDAKGESKEAVFHYHHAIRLKPHNAHFWNNRGVAYSKLGFDERAIQDFHEAIRLKNDSDEFYNNRGAVYTKLGQNRLAIKDYDEAIRLNSHNAFAYYNRGNLYVKEAQYQNALEDYGEAIRLMPNFTNAYNNRGTVYLKHGNTSSGCHDLLNACLLGNCINWEAAKAMGTCR